ncbi:PEGA domain-containing protein [Persicimonas caeni]|uniref:PEGA domain-containing protein n=1 Tax=Persicimonas caeni TaxID=2292766 RepID=A0A4Y6PWI4_PERCE|nr:PEGA domain-containing protein [Persicimonas caeni]QDG52590.1 PEGA domain-containing protein [Persicimonas caeni]QED33812.1 PEGA domain-containing protein [Persicimonas caeni]
MNLGDVEHSYAQDPEPGAQGAPDAKSETQQAAAASRKEVVLWTFRAPGLPQTMLPKMHQGLEASLTGETGRHLFGEKAFRTYVAQKSAPTPDCLKGLEACVSPQTLAFDALGLTMVIRVDVTRNADGLTANYALVDRRGEVAREASVQGKTPRELAFALAGEIFDATASITLRSEPEGAQVEIDGEAVGTTPLNYRLPVGKHTYTMRLADHRVVEGSFELESSGAKDIHEKLDELPGVLLVRDAPDGAKVFVDGEERGLASERLELEPGTYTVEIRAKGFDTHSEEVTLSAGQVAEKRVRLEKSNPLLKDIEPNSIAVNSYIGRLSFDQSLHMTTFRDARGDSAGTDFEFLGFAKEDQPSVLGEDLRRLTAPSGLRFDFTYSWENFGLVLLSASYASSSLDQKAFVDSSASDNPISVTVTDMSRLQLRPLQVRYRHFYKNFAPFVELGTGINIQWVEVDGELLEQPVTLSNSEAFWTLGLGGSYFFTPNVFGMLRYSAQFYFDDGLGTENVLSVGAGVALPNLFGFEPEPPEKL